ncbi:MAG: hypothetical protein H6551_03825 [Chitinophagales bacterium]|nr:hypothetical protein [Chitinophagaceae bacterium]MCB9064252.1 hypothetical protein [Chitinophagales bacterium]
MTDIPNIIQTKTLGNETDVFWQDSELLNAISPRTVLVLTLRIQEGSAESTQLEKILAACKLNAEQYNLIQLDNNEQLAWHQLKQSAQPAVVILFGIHPSNLGISAMFRFNSLNNFDKTQWIPTLSLQELEKNQEAKKALWTDALKPLFADKE